MPPTNLPSSSPSPSLPQRPSSSSLSSPSSTFASLLATYPSLHLLTTRPGVSPYPAAFTSALCFASALAALRGGIASSARGWPGYTPLLGFGAVYAGASHVIGRDLDNGCSTATAWGVVYAVLFARSSLASRKVGPIGLLGCVLATTGVYGNEMWDSYLE
ncbi:hypothetical protein HKX48_001169 [Thoreauomyces humboldtii]|nr:hypothetical protein HKX48_001169 [Thoreauomyces humboldtii]